MALIRYQEPEQTTWSPFDRLATLRDEMNRLFEGSLPGFGQNLGFFSGWSPALDLFEDKDTVFVQVELPGMKREDIDISLHDGALTISGERKQQSEAREGETFRSERYFGRFHRTVTLPTAVDANRVKATYKEGILTVELPKTEEAKPKQIQVNIS